MSAVLPGFLPSGATREPLEIATTVLASLRASPPVERPGATVLLVPGYTGSKEDFSLLLGPLAAAGYRVVALDQRGQYQSAGTGDVTSYTVPRLAADLLSAVRALGPGPVHLVGHSFGGLVARSAVLTDPGAVRSLVLMGSGPAGLTGDRRTGLELFLPLLAEHDLPTAISLVESVQAADPQALARPPELVAFLRERLLATDPAALIGMGRALIDEPDRTDALRSTGLPTLVLHGQYDDAWTPAVQADMAHRLGSRLAVIDGAFHSPAVEAPEATTAALLTFFDTVDAPARRTG